MTTSRPSEQTASDDRPISFQREATNAAVMALAVFICAILGTLTRPYDLISAFWPANPAMLGLLIRIPALARPSGWISAIFAFILADMVTGSTLKITIWMTIGNIVGVAAAYILVRRMDVNDLRLRRPFSVLKLLLALMLGGVASGIFGSIAAPVLFDRDPVSGWLTWYTAELVNNIAILPVMLTVPPLTFSKLKKIVAVNLRYGIAGLLPLLALIVSLLGGIWVGGPSAFAFPMPALLWCALSYSIAGTAFLTLCFSTSIMIAISSGWVGPLFVDDFSGGMMSIRLGVSLAALGPIMVAGARDSLMANESRWNSALESARQGVWDTNIRNGKTFFSRQWKAMLGYENSEINGGLWEWIERLHPDDRERVTEDLQALQNPGGKAQYESEYRIRHKNGDWLWMLGRGSVIEYQSDGAPARMIGTQTDITELKLAEKQMAIMNERMQLAMRAGGIGIWEVDFDSRMIIWDDRMHELYGLEYGSFSGYAGEWISYVAPEDKRELTILWENLDWQEAIVEKKYRIVWRNGETRYMHSLARIIRNQTGRPVRALGTNADITAQMADRDQLAKAKEEAERASIAKSQFLAIMSHELRTPMTGVMGLADLVWLDQQLSENSRRYIDMMRKSARALLTILDDILDFSKIDAERLVLERISFNPQTILKDVVELMRPSASGRGSSVEISAENLPASVCGDPTRLRQVLYNLIGNAIKFTEAGVIRVSVRGIVEADRIELRFEISDTGIGMSEEQIAGLFNAFFQADASTTRRFGGTGLGLAISKRLIEAMGGNIQVASNIGKGSTFSFNVFVEPSETEHEREQETDEFAKPSSQAESVHILLAEDNEVSRVLVVAMLEYMGYTVTAVENGAEALAMVEREEYSLVLMDMQMPEMDGPTATRNIRALSGPRSRVPVIGMSADAVAEHRSEHMSAGLDAYLTKPIVWAKLESAIAAVLQETEGRRAEEEGS